MTRLAYVIAIILTLAGCPASEVVSTDMAMQCANGNTQRWSIACCDRIQPGSAYPTGTCIALDACYDYAADLVRCSCLHGQWACKHLTPPEDGGTGTD
jgi:hypothetical protein